MVRATPAQLAMFKRQLNGQPPLHLPRGPKSKQQRAAQPENQVEGQLIGFLRAKGWIVTRRHVGKMVPLGRMFAILNSGKPITREVLLQNIVDVGAKYAADWHAERYVTRLLKQTLELEVKGPKERPSEEQLNWIRERNMLGFPATWADSLEMFVEWYRAEGFDSGL